jgi:hypothetical protein
MADFAHGFLAQGAASNAQGSNKLALCGCGCFTSSSEEFAQARTQLVHDRASAFLGFASPYRLAMILSSTYS